MATASLANNQSPSPSELTGQESDPPLEEGLPRRYIAGCSRILDRITITVYITCPILYIFVSSVTLVLEISSSWTKIVKLMQVSAPSTAYGFHRLTQPRLLVLWIGDAALLFPKYLSYLKRYAVATKLVHGGRADVHRHKAQIIIVFLSLSIILTQAFGTSLDSIGKLLASTLLSTLCPELHKEIKGLLSED